MAGRVRAVRRRRHPFGDLGRERVHLPLASLERPIQQHRSRTRQRPVRFRHARDQVAAFEKLTADVLPGADLLRQLQPPGGEVIDPGFDRVLVIAECLDAEGRLPPIVAERRHRRLMPRPAPRVPIQHHRRDRVVSIREHVRADDDALPRCPLDRKPPAVHARQDVFDDDSTLQGRMHFKKATDDLTTDD